MSNVEIFTLPLKLALSTKPDTIASPFEIEYLKISYDIKNLICIPPIIGIVSGISSVNKLKLCPGS
jgi:hypothetical protein